MDRGRAANMTDAPNTLQCGGGRGSDGSGPEGGPAWRHPRGLPLVAVSLQWKERHLAIRVLQALRSAWQQIPHTMREPTLAYWQRTAAVPLVEVLDDWADRGDERLAVGEACLLLRMTPDLLQQPSDEVVERAFTYWLVRTYMHVEGDRQTVWRVLQEDEPWPADLVKQERRRREYAWDVVEHLFGTAHR